MWRYGMYAAILAVVFPLTAWAQTSPAGTTTDSPLRIERCLVISRSELLDPLNSLRIDFVTGLGVRFVNLRHATASTVRFTFRYQGETVVVTERGTFATGLPIERTYATFAGQVSGGRAADCNVSQITYDDGTTLVRAPVLSAKVADRRMSG